MPSRAEPVARDVAVRPASQVALVGHLLHAVGLLALVVMLWQMLTPPAAGPMRLQVSAAGGLDRGWMELLRTAPDTLDVVLEGTPDARTRAGVRALRASGRVVRLERSTPLPALAVSAESEWRATGAARIQVVNTGASPVAMRDGAGVLDSMTVDSAGAQVRSGPVQGALTAALRDSRAAVRALVAAAPAEARVLVVGEAGWESKFIVTTLEEAGWPVDAAVTLSPKVTVTQGLARTPQSGRHAIVVVLPGASAAAVAPLPSFVRRGAGLIIVGSAARLPGLASLRAGSPGETVPGEVGAEASDMPRHGLDLVPMRQLAPDAVPLETRDGMIAVAARRVGAGRVVQVGYDNSWLWRMAGNDEAPGAHRRWWSSLLASVVSMRSAASAGAVPQPTNDGLDSLDAAPTAALARDLGLPRLQAGAVSVAAGPGSAAWRDSRWLLSLALVSLVASWFIRRWRGLA